MPPPMSSVKYILATKLSSPSSSWTSSGRLLATRFVRMAADGVETEGNIISRISSAASSSPLLSSFSFVAALYENEKASYQTRVSHPPYSFPCTVGMLPTSLSLQTLSGLFYLDVALPLSPDPLLSRPQCTLVIRRGKGIRVQTWFRVMSWLKE